jgi:polysaccharide export outer membrane protein
MSKLVFLLCVSAIAFAQATGSVAPADSFVPNLPVQKIGANDLVGITVYDSPEFSRTVRVATDGTLRLPMLKQRIKAEGLLPSELETAVAEALKAEQLVVDPFVTVTMAEYHSRPISVAGSVKTPLTFQAIGTVTLLEAIARAGGLSGDAGTEILVSKQQAGDGAAKGSLVTRIPVKDLMDSANQEYNVKLNGGEEIRVPEAQKIYVLGNVRKPGAYPVQDSGETTVLKMLAVAEGLAPYASKQAYIYRREASGTKNEIPIELRKIMHREAPDAPLAANDILYIPDATGKRTTWSVLEKVLMFGGATVSGILVYSAVR